MLRTWLSLCALALGVGCSKKDAVPNPARDSGPSRAKDDEESSVGASSSPHDVITAELLRTHTKALADDAMEGRRPGTAGGARAVQYIVTAMKDLELQPAGDDGEYTQHVPMRSVRTDPAQTHLKISGGKAPIPLEFGESFAGGTFAAAGTHPLDAPLVFVGYGVTAPEYEWDDYEGLDVRGKIVLVFVGDPPTGDSRFAGPAMTYYGRWTYKFSRAREAGAAGCLVIHEPEPASYGWNVVRSSWSGDRFEVADTRSRKKELPPLSIQGWVSQHAAEQIATAAGTSLEAWHARALEPTFSAKPLDLELSGTIVTTEQMLSDDNVVGRIPGRGRSDEAVYVVAHWDHLGIDGDAKPGADAIFNGAVDNASGVAALLSVAAGVQARARAGRPPDRSVVFLATTAEEQGLLGSRFHAAHPVVSLDKAVAAINLDSMNVGGRTKTVEVVGAGQSTLEDILAEVVGSQGRRVIPDSRPQAGGFYRSDHFPFALRGVPALYFHGGADLEKGGTKAGEVWAAERARRYHTVEDQYDPSWSFEGAQQDAEAVLDVVLRVADADDPPRWKPGSEFAAARH